MEYIIRKYIESDYHSIIEVMAYSFSDLYKKMFRFDNEELINFLEDINIVPKNQADGFFVAEIDGNIVGMVNLKWKSLKLGSRLEILKLSSKYSNRKVFRAIIAKLTLFERVAANECYIDNITVLKEYRGLGITRSLHGRAEEFALDKKLNKLTIHISESSKELETLNKQLGFRTRKIFKSSIIGRFIEEESFKYMVKTPGVNPNQLNIGMFTDTYMPQINGVATSIYSLAKELEKMGHKVYIITIKDKGRRCEFNGEILRVPGISLHLLKGTDYKLANILSSDKIEKIIKDMNLDIIHSHTEFSIGLLATYVAKKYMIPQVHTYHTMYDEWIHYVTNFEPFQKIAVEFIKMYMKGFTGVCQKIIVPTEKTKEVLTGYKVATDMVIIPTGIDFSKFVVQEGHEKVKELKEELYLNEDDFVCLNISRLSKEKKVAAVIENVKRVIEKNPRVKLIIIGDGPERSNLEKLAESYKENIKFLGRVPWDQIGYYYKLGDAFVVASRFETQGLTVIEALSSTIPVICPDDDAFLNIVEDGENGLIFTSDDEIEEKILKLLDEEIYKYIYSNTTNSVLRYSSEYFAESILKEYNSLLV
ncbi:MAG: GNAT family N-acetyltransferase [Acidaminobacteraceae bacterium]